MDDDDIFVSVPIMRIESPCINICELDAAQRLCTGCARTLDEIGGWTSGTAEWRAAVMAALPERKAALSSIPPSRNLR